MAFSTHTPHQTEHLSEEQLQASVRGDSVLTGAQQRHLAGCVACQQLLTDVEQLQRELKIAQLSEPSSAAMERYFALFQDVNVNAANPLSALAAQVADFAQALKASVMWNGRERLAMQGVRNGATTTYRMLYSTARAEIELMIEMVAGNFKIEGDVLPIGPAEQLLPLLIEVHENQHATRSGVPLFVGESDHEGRFHISSLPAGDYALYFAPAEGTALLIETLELA